MTIILVIEDDNETRYCIKTNLIKRKYDVVDYVSAEEGTAWLKTRLPDLVVLDMILAGQMNGVDFLRVITNNPHLHHIPVIVISGSEAYKEQQSFMNVNINGWLKKPIDVRHLVQIIKKAVGD